MLACYTARRTGPNSRKLGSAAFFIMTNCNDEFHHECNIMHFIFGYVGLELGGQLCVGQAGLKKVVFEEHHYWKEIKSELTEMRLRRSPKRGRT